jgi:integrase/recombinase XerC
MTIVEQYETFLRKEKRASEHTVLAYIKDVESFLQFSEIDNASISSLKEVSYHLVRSWIVNLVSEGVTNKSVNRKLSSLRGFFKWTKQVEPSIQNPMQRIKGLKVGKRIPEFVKQNELQSEEAVSQVDLSIKDALIIELFYQTGIRLSELIQLKDTDVTNSSIKVIGKRNKERLIPISKELYIAVQDWIELKNAEFPLCTYLFCTQKGVQLYPKYVYRLVNKYLSLRTKIKKKSPHVLRHTFATHMLNNGAGLEIIKDLLGHANLSATQIYTHNSFSQLTSIYKKAHPRG